MAFSLPEVTLKIVGAHYKLLTGFSSILLTTLYCSECSVLNCKLIEKVVTTVVLLLLISDTNLIKESGNCISWIET